MVQKMQDSVSKDIINECFEKSIINSTDILRQLLNFKNSLPQNPGPSFVEVQQHKPLSLDYNKSVPLRCKWRMKSHYSEIHFCLQQWQKLFV